MATVIISTPKVGDTTQRIPSTSKSRVTCPPVYTQIYAHGALGVWRKQLKQLLQCRCAGQQDGVAANSAAAVTEREAQRQHRCSVQPGHLRRVASTHLAADNVRTLSAVHDNAVRHSVIASGRFVK